jgi:hypothetical protein
VGLERGPLSLVSPVGSIEELPDKYVADPGLVNRDKRSWGIVALTT